MPHSKKVLVEHWKDRTNASSPDEVEDGFVTISDEATAEWVYFLLFLIYHVCRSLASDTFQDGDQTRYVPPTPYQSAVQSAKQSCGLGLLYLQNTIDKAASVVAHVAADALPTALALKQRGSSIMDINGWKPPKNALSQEVSEPKSSREVKLDAYRQEMALKARQKKESGIQFAEDKEPYDCMGVSTAWRKSEKRSDEKLRKQRLLEEWKARDEP